MQNITFTVDEDILRIINLAGSVMREGKYPEAIYLAFVAKSEALKEKDLCGAAAASYLMDLGFEEIKRSVRKRLLSNGKNASTYSVLMEVYKTPEYKQLEILAKDMSRYDKQELEGSLFDSYTHNFIPMGLGYITTTN